MIAVPIATYRVQLHGGFTFDDVAGLAPYLSELGVSHVYCSPILAALPGSTHGYDVVDHHRIDEERGGREGFERMSAALTAAGLGLVVDIVPNHMAADAASNRWLWDVLENGPSSRYAAYFDIDWNPPEERLFQRVLVPVLADHYGRVLDRGGIAVERDGGTLVVAAEGVRVPLSPRTLDVLLSRAATAAASDELASIAEFLGRLPPASATDVTSVAERHRDKEVLRVQLARLLAADPLTAEAVDTEIADLNTDPDGIDELLERQNYRLAHWKVASQELDYRRFFDVAELVALRSEDARVFADTHDLVLGLCEAGNVGGLRIDHPDGLRDPQAYLERLRERAGPDVWIVVEKILAPDEALPPAWRAATAGTTGYEFLNAVNGLFVDPAGQEPLTAAYADLTGEPTDAVALVAEAKEHVLHETLAADVNRLTNLVVAVCERQRRARDLTRHDLHNALREIAASLGVYRTYLRPGHDPEPVDVARIQAAVAAAASRRPDLDDQVWPYLADLLLLRLPGDSGAADAALRFQQLTGPVMAKSVEDTVFYRHHLLSGLNEVGAEPGRFAAGVDEFHAANEAAARDWGARMLTLSTHDTKRSADVRARLVALSEIPDEWRAAVTRWMVHNARHRRSGSDWPDPNTEYLLYQTMVGAWPISADRLVDYLLKAVREAKRHTSWVDPDPVYEDDLVSFTRALLADGKWSADFEAFVAPLVAAGRVTSLAQLLLELTSPGVPDLYQGSELWDLSLVDPDNRRPVDYGRRRSLMEKVAGAGVEEAMALDDEGAPKLWLVQKALAARRRRPEDFAPDARYRAMPAAGERSAQVVAFERGLGTIAVAPRLVVTLGRAGGWGDTTLEVGPGPWTDALTGAAIDGGAVPLGALLARFPVALLQRSQP